MSVVNFNLEWNKGDKPSENGTYYVYVMWADEMTVLLADYDRNEGPDGTWYHDWETAHQLKQRPTHWAKQPDRQYNLPTPE